MIQRICILLDVDEPTPLEAYKAVRKFFAQTTEQQTRLHVGDWESADEDWFNDEGRKLDPLEIEQIRMDAIEHEHDGCLERIQETNPMQLRQLREMRDNGTLGEARMCEGENVVVTGRVGRDGWAHYIDVYTSCDTLAAVKAETA